MFTNKSFFTNRHLSYLLVFFVAFAMSGFGALFIDIGVVHAARTCVSTGSSTDWNTSSTWLCGGTPAVPVVGDTVEISHAVAIGDYTINEVYDIEIKDGGTLTQNNTSTQTISHRLTVRSGGTLTHGNNSDDHLYEVDFAADEIVIDVGGSVTAYALGYDGDPGQLNVDGAKGPGPGEGGEDLNSGGGGGAHYGVGGAGEDYNFPPAGGSTTSYQGDFFTLGSGGGGVYSWGAGGHGGGLIILNANSDLTVNGTINARGQGGTTTVQGNGSGGGGGGAIKLLADSVLGTPTSITAAGGGGAGTGSQYRAGGGGGGGYVHVTYTTTSTITTATVSGGSAGSSPSATAVAGGDGYFELVQLAGEGGGGGEGVPEFSTYVYLLTIILAFGALYQSQKKFNFTNVRIP